MHVLKIVAEVVGGLLALVVLLACIAAAMLVRDAEDGNFH